MACNAITLVNNHMLTEKERERACHISNIAPHLQPFMQKWANHPDCPPHFEDMIRRFLRLTKKEQCNFYVIDDVLYTIDQVSERYRWREKYRAFRKSQV